MLFGASFVLALENNYPDFFGKSLDNDASLGDFVCYFFNAGLSIALSLVAIIIAYGGIKYLIAYGKGNFTSDAKEWIKAGILGLLIITCSSLIIYTVNPNIGSCNIGVLSIINPAIFPWNHSSLSSDTLVATYQEIPLGILTENLLTRTTLCPSYDKYGDLLTPDYSRQTGAGGQPEPNSKGDIAQDRVACLRQMVEGAQKKAETTAELSASIARLMDTCSCETKDSAGKYTGQSQCQIACNCQTTKCPGGSCINNCPNGLCQQKPNTYDCCPPGVKDKIEHGPIFVHMDANKEPGSSNIGKNGQPCEIQCTSDDQCTKSIFINAYGNKETMYVERCDPDTHTCGKVFKGLDEFRCNPNEIQPSSPNKSELNGGNKKCEDIMKLIAVGGTQQGKIGFTVITIDKWTRLTLWQQIKFFQENLANLLQKDIYGLDSDIKNLNKARQSLSTCYSTISSVDLFNKYTVFNQNKRVEIVKPSSLLDYTTGKTIDSSKYCNGFNYANSVCLNRCNNMCPDTDQQAIQAFAECEPSTGADDSEATSCVKNAYTARVCPYSEDPSKTFEQCMSDCQTKCKDSCGFEYPSCSPEYNFCDSQCSNNGKCVIDNADQCLFGANNIINCARNSTDEGNIQYCIKNAYLCKNGSNEFSGYPDCVDNTKSALNCSSITNQSSCVSAGGIKGGCVWVFGSCIRDYSASYLYKNKNIQKCENAFAPATSGDCKGTNPNANCKDVCPEAAKCPTASDCPTCPCDQFNEPVKYYSPNISTAVKQGSCSSGCPAGMTCIDNVCMNDGKIIYCNNDAPCIASGQTCSPITKTCVTNAGREGNEWKTPNIAAYQMVGPQCNEFSYNQDPLTFYCQDNWWNDPQKDKNSPNTPVGGEKICKQENDIPIGQTIDNSIIWAKQFADGVETIGKDLQPMLEQMDKMGDAITGQFTSLDGQQTKATPIKNYCTCTAKLENNNSICENICEYKEQTIQVPVEVTVNVPVQVQVFTTNSHGYSVPMRDVNGNYIYRTEIQQQKQIQMQDQIQCTCTPTICKGNPCQQIIDYHSQLWNYYKKVKEDFVAFNFKMIQEPRSDILKSLTYSRQQTNSCSIKNTVYGGSETRTFSCSRAMDELLPPINQDKIKFAGKEWEGYCYGKDLGKVSGHDLTDDWFCCEQWNKEQKPNNNPIYNIKNNNF